MNKLKAGIGGTILVLVLTILSIVLGKDLVSDVDIPPPGDEVVTVPDAGEAPPWYEIYFTNPACPPLAERQGGLDETIAADISQAQRQVDVAAYDLDAEPIVQALIDLEGRGVVVRVVTDEDNADLSSIRRLRRNGISVAEDKRSALMHDKFVVIDGRTVWTGSLNLTTNGVYCNNNHMVRLDLPRLATNYITEMDEMYVQSEFGPTSPDNTPNEQLVIQGIEIENYFGPEREISPIIARSVARAQQEILFLAFSFTDEQIGGAMLGRADAGVNVRGVFETVGSDTEFSYFSAMRDAGLANLRVRTDGNNQIMHHKMIIIDQATVIFGSFNFSDSANRRNDENIVIVHDPAFAGFFLEEFEAVWREAAGG